MTTQTTVQGQGSYELEVDAGILIARAIRATGLTAAYDNGRRAEDCGGLRYVGILRERGVKRGFLRTEVLPAEFIGVVSLKDDQVSVDVFGIESVRALQELGGRLREQLGSGKTISFTLTQELAKGEYIPSP
ncbi:MAG: hypothetical protein RLZZ324_451, partial [Candidatus Parcubacteria bacterium]